MKENKMWTKDELKKVISLWENSSLKEMCELLGVKEFQLQYIANQLRKAGIKMAKKHKIGYLQNLIQEIVAER